MQSSYRVVARRPVVRFVRNAGLIALVLLAVAQTSSALLPNVSRAISRLASVKLFVNPDSPARRQANEWRRSRPVDAALMERIASQPLAHWFGVGNRNVQSDVANTVARASLQGATPVLVAYNIPNRDCGSLSAGGSSDPRAYRKWIREFAAGLSGRTTVVVLEPDALAGLDCLSTKQKEERYGLLRDAVQVLKGARAVVYLDAGHARWHTPDVIAQRLESAGIAQADGFSLNVSNYLSTPVNVTYGDQISRRVGGKHYIIDTSRNGVGGKGGEWCNVPGQALGSAPSTKTGYALVDAFLWVKHPGESDGPCNGGPRAGSWWPQYALGLAQRQGNTLAARD